jgi:pyrroloquinoline quinone (PQQ) biosynthesis protein C
MQNHAFVDSVIREIVQPGVERLMETRYFSELREGKLSKRRLQGFAVQHYLHNVALCKGLVLCMAKNAANPDLYEHFREQFNEEQNHPDLAKKFGIAVGLNETDFADAAPIFECLAHTSVVIRGMFLGSPAETRTGALVNESMVCRYSEEFDTHLRRHYGLGDKECQFFTVHRVADQEHTKAAAEVVARYATSPEQQRAVREAARNMVRFKIAKFEGIYQAYS